MIKSKFWCALAFIGMLSLCFVACNDDDKEIIEVEPDIPNPDAPEAVPLANDATVPNNAIILGSLPEEFATAIPLRFPHIGADINNAQIVLVDCSQINNFTSEIIFAYQQRGLIIVLQPQEDVLNKWLKDANIPNKVCMNDRDQMLYAFCKTHSYLMDERWEGTEINENLNFFIDWVNEVLSSNSSSSSFKVDGEAMVQDLIRCQQFNHEVRFSLRVEEAHEGGATPDSISGVGSVVIAYKVYPIYAFNSDNGTNDEYYLVETTTSVMSKDMTLLEPGPCMETKYWYPTYHRWVNSHGWWWFKSYCRICGFYLTNLWTTSELVQYDNKQETPITGLRFPARYAPIPETTENKTTYSSQTSWDIGSDYGFGGGYSEEEGAISEGSITFSGKLSYSYSTSREISDINIANGSTESKAAYNFVVKNLPYYQDASISLSDPPLISVSTGIFDTQWIWHVPDVPVRSTQTYYLKSSIDVSYGSCHFWTTGLDFVQHNNQRPIENGPDVIYQAITPPNRIPTGIIEFVHSDSINSTVTDVKFTLDGASTPSYQSGDNQYKVDDKLTTILEMGSYNVEFTKGTPDGEKTYVSKKPVKIELAKSTRIYSDFNMKEKE